MTQKRADEIREKIIIVKCPACGKERRCVVADSVGIVSEVFCCRYCRELFDKKGKVVLGRIG